MNLDQKKDRKKERKRERKKERKKTPASLARAVGISPELVLHVLCFWARSDKYEGQDFYRGFLCKKIYNGFPFEMNQILIRDFPLKFTRDFLIKNFMKEFPLKWIDKKKERKKERKKEKNSSLARAVPLIIIIMTEWVSKYISLL